MFRHQRERNQFHFSSVIGFVDLPGKLFEPPIGYKQRQKGGNKRKSVHVNLPVDVRVSHVFDVVAQPCSRSLSIDFTQSAPPHSANRIITASHWLAAERSRSCKHIPLRRPPVARTTRWYPRLIHAIDCEISPFESIRHHDSLTIHPIVRGPHSLPCRREGKTL